MERERERNGAHNNGALAAMAPLKLDHLLKRKVADYVAVQHEERLVLVVRSEKRARKGQGSS